MQTIEPVVNHDDKKRHVVDVNESKKMKARLEHYVQYKTLSEEKSFKNIRHVPAQLEIIFTPSHKDKEKSNFLSLDYENLQVKIALDKGGLFVLEALENQLYHIYWGGKVVVPAFTAEDFVNHYKDKMPEEVAAVVSVALGLN